MTNVISNEGSLILKGKSSISKGLILAEVVDGIVVVQPKGWRLNYNDTTVDGESFDSAEALLEKISSFKRGGGNGDGVASVTGDLVNNSDPKNPVVNMPVEVIGYLNLSNNATYSVGSSSTDVVKILSSTSPSGLNNINLNYPKLDNAIKKVVIIFSVNVATVNNTPVNSTINNIPTTAKKGDVWTVVYDKGDFTWDLVSINSMPKWYIDQKLSVSDYEAMLIEDTDLVDEQTSVTINTKYPNAKIRTILIAPNIGSGMMFLKISNGADNKWFAWAGQII